MQKNGFVGAELIKIRSRLSEASSHGEQEAAGQKPVQKPVQPAVTATASEPAIDKEWRKALERRWDEFRHVKRDFTGRLTESLAAIPEEIRLSKDHTEQLQRALEKYAHLLDEIQSLDDSRWDKGNLTSELSAAMRKVEHVRLEYLRISSKLRAIQRESSAAEGAESNGGAVIPEICSISWKQGFKIGLAFMMPLIITIAIAAMIIAIAMFFAMRT